jgi:hypothetical protein
MKRKLHDAPEKEKRRLFIPIFIASILIFSIFGIIFSSPSETQGSNTLTYEDWTFRRAQTGWTVTIDGFDVTTFYTPLDLLDITIPSTISTDLKTAENLPLLAQNVTYI